MLSTKMADPRFIARVRELGRIVGVTLLNAFVSISNWTSANWPQIVGGFRQFMAIMRASVKLGGQLKSVLLTITAPLRVQLKIILAIWDKVLAAVSTAAGLLSHLPGFLGGDKFKGIQQSIEAVRSGLKNPLGQERDRRRRNRQTRTGSPGYLNTGGVPRRAGGGPVMSGRAYMVGERGPEMFVPGSSGTVVPGGASGDVVLILDGREIARASLNHIQRLGKRGASQQRGRLGGQNLALS
jgi:hypothetical protein